MYLFVSQRIKRLAGGDAELEFRLTAAACALVYCYAEYPEDSEAYQSLYRLAQIGNSNDLASERALLSSQRGITFTANREIQYALFDYGGWDNGFDIAHQYDNTHELGLFTRAEGFGQFTLGMFGLLGTAEVAAPACATIAGCGGVVVAGGMSIDAMYTGGAKFITGDEQDTLTHQAFMSLGLSPQAASYGEMFLGFGSVGAMMSGLSRNGGIMISNVGSEASGSLLSFEQSLANTALRNDAQINATIWDGAVPRSVVNQAEIDWLWLERNSPVVIGETMVRVEGAASRVPGSIILNDMPDFGLMGQNADQVTSSMMSYNRQWILDQMRSGRPIIDIGYDPNRIRPSIFYQMEQNMIKNYQLLHPAWNGIARK